MKKLIAMTDFAIYQNSIVGDFRKPVFRYAKLLKQPLELWMFVPCKLINGVWVVLEKPKFYYTQESLRNLKIGIELDTALEINKKAEEHQQAKERCLFEGYDGTIEQLQSLIKLKITVENMVKYNLKLTETALKQIGL